MPPPANSRRGIGPSACSRTEGKRRGSLFSASSIVPGTVWAWVSMIMRRFPLSFTRCRSGAGAAEPDRRGERLVDLLGRQQRRRPRATQAGRRGGQRHGARGDIVRQIDDRDDVVFAEGKIKRLELAADALASLADCLATPRCLVLLQALHPLGVIGSGDQVFRHDVFLPIFNRPVAGWIANITLGLRRWRGSFR